MGKLEELDKLDKEIKNAEISLKSIQNNIEKNSNEIAILNPRKKELEQNLEFHKKEGIVPIAHEYGKAKRELSKIKARLILLTSDHKNSLLAFKEVERILTKFKKDYEALSSINDNNVLRVLFGGNRGKR